jgi:hypothetical protein
VIACETGASHTRTAPTAFDITEQDNAGLDCHFLQSDLPEELKFQDYLLRACAAWILARTVIIDSLSGDIFPGLLIATEAT